MKKVRKALGKFLSKNIVNQDGRSWLVSTISDIIKEHPAPMKKCKISFSIDKDSIERNDIIFESLDYDFEKVTNANINTIITPGIEFRTQQTLTKIWKYHKDWKLISSILFNGADYPCQDLPSEKERVTDLEYMIQRGNHPSASDSENNTALIKNYKKEVNKGWMIPISIKTIRKLKLARIIPVGVAPHWSIDDKGNRTLKRG